MVARSYNPMLSGPLEPGQPAQLPFAHKIALLGFFLVLTDILQNYFIQQAIGVSLPVNVVAAFIVLILYLKDPHRLFPSKSLSVLLACVVAMFVLGFYIGDYSVSSSKIYSRSSFMMTLAIINSVAMLLLGFYCFQWLPTTALVKTILLAGICHAIVCMVALMQIYPAWFPVSYMRPDTDYSTAILRKEIATDPNFQVFFFLPTAALLALPFARLRTIIALLVTAVGAYTLAQVQSRSGLLVLAGCLGLALAAPLRMKALGRKKVVLLACLLVAFAGLYAQQILNVLEGLLARFTAKSSHQSALARLEALIYFIENFWRPEFMIPRGPAVYSQTHGPNVAHSNITAMMLRGGLVGVIAWFAVYLIPTLKLTRRFLIKRMDSLGVVVLIISISLLVVQLSLNLYSWKQLWMWAGTALGVLARLRSQEAAWNRQSQLAVTYRGAS